MAQPRIPATPRGQAVKTPLLTTALASESADLLQTGAQPVSGRGRDAVLVAGGFMAVQCDRPVQGGMIESARTRPRPIGDIAANGFVDAKLTLKMA